MSETKESEQSFIEKLDLKTLFSGVEGTNNYKQLLSDFSDLNKDLLEDKAVTSTIAEWFLQGSNFIGTSASMYYGNYLKSELNTLTQITAFEKEIGINCNNFNVDNADHMEKLTKLKDTQNPSLKNLGKALFNKKLYGKNGPLKGWEVFVNKKMRGLNTKWSKTLTKKWTKEIIKRYASRTLLVQSIVSFAASGVTFFTLKSIHNAKHKKLTTQIQKVIEDTLNVIEKDLKKIANTFVKFAAQGQENIPHDDMKAISSQLKSTRSKLEKIKKLIVYQRSKDEKNKEKAKSLRNKSFLGGVYGLLNLGIYIGMASNPICWVAGGAALVNFINAAYAQGKINDIEKVLDKWNELEEKAVLLISKIDDLEDNSVYRKWREKYYEQVDESVKVRHENDINEIRGFFTKYDIIKHFNFFVKEQKFSKLSAILRMNNEDKLMKLGLKYGQCVEILEGFKKYEKELRFQEQARKLKDNDSSYLQSMLRNLMKVMGTTLAGLALLQYLDQNGDGTAAISQGYPILSIVLGASVAGQVISQYLSNNNNKKLEL